MILLIVHKFCVIVSRFLKENNQIELIQYAFSGEKTVLSIETYPQSFKNCNFQDANYLVPENKEILRRLGAVTNQTG